MLHHKHTKNVPKVALNNVSTDDDMDGVLLNNTHYVGNDFFKKTFRFIRNVYCLRAQHPYQHQ